MDTPAEVIRILHVDDQPDFTDLVATFLERDNERFAVRTASSAEAGLATLADEDVDCIVSDYEMPGRNGIEFLQTVREDHPNLPVLLFTGKGSEEVASDAISAGVTDYLQKGAGTDQYEILANRIENAVGARRARQERQRQLDAIESAREGISTLDHDGRYTYVNRAYADLYGYEPAEMVGEHWGLVYPDEDEAQIREDVLATVSEEGYWHGTTTGLRADGTTFIEDHVLATSGEGELVCTVRDVTEQRERERTLERTYDFFTAAERIGDLGAWEFDETGESIWTAGTRRIFGVDEDFEATIEDCLAFVHLEHRQALRADIRAALTAGDTYDRHVRLALEDDAERWVRVSGRPVEGRDDRRVVRGFIQDVTAQRQQEEALRRHNERLERFTSIVSHDLRNPLSVAEGRLSLARGECESEHLATVETAHERMRALIDDLLTLARGGDVQPELGRVDLTDLVEACWQTVDAAGARLSVVDLPVIRADDQRLRQLVENLFRNAVVHGPGPREQPEPPGDHESDAGPILSPAPAPPADDATGLTISVGALDDGFYVEDDGVGIPQTDHDRVFADGYTTEDHGTGLGLRIVQQVAADHGWEVRATNGSDGGARFEVTGVDLAD